MKWIIEPETALVDQKVDIRLTGVEPGRHVTIRARMNEMPGAVYEAESYATFIAGSSGEIRLDQEAPIEGTYSGIAPMGLFWSMEASKVRYNTTRKLDQLLFEPASSEIILTAEIDKKIVMESRLRRQYVCPNVQLEEVRDNGIIGKYFFQPDQAQSPGIIVLGGGEGGLGPAMNYAALFASYGLPALALAYFRFEHLPERLQEIPLEYFYSAIQWLRQREEIHPDKIGVFGRSKGAELSLILGATYPEIRAVAASSPSSTMCIGHFEPAGHNEFNKYSSWSYQGSALPYVTWTNQQCEEARGCFKTATRIDCIHRAALEQCDRLDEVSIPVENIAGSLLIITSSDDHWWPTELYGNRIADRLKDKGFTHAFEHLHYEGAGHMIRYPYIPSTQLTMNGGTASANAQASADSWQRIKQFFKASLQ
ncbi:acyl-CoA thioesterase/bile acid-CoA:amino acid N-acyltransferase family protein [Paenibacillus sp. J2TS4]|uniref:acyl-CoA thioesterase/bile acid-CoA:amino acid N-acyltransferase family protein n=1 Tax=Paenibacillus sp. J2TS4 TaxID=2807194 RepID=UPI001B19121A|nr:acyl-CoA thioesterase/bile acid-CoA:amino acid N-acyltransferase family protein [Paenibacillus sp. J2TS4]GIP31593.1 acyl-CoA thioesterase [Paenibacillus sp. J2TS4]